MIGAVRSVVYLILLDFLVQSNLTICYKIKLNSNNYTAWYLSALFQGSSSLGPLALPGLSKREARENGGGASFALSSDGWELGSVIPSRRCISSV